MSGYVHKPRLSVVEAPAKHRHGTFNQAKCGTYAGYRQHERYDVPKCLPCKVEKSIRDAAAYARRVGRAA